MSNAENIFQNSETKNQYSIFKNQINSSFYEISNFNLDNIEINSFYKTKENYNLRENEENEKKKFHYLQLR